MARPRKAPDDRYRDVMIRMPADLIEATKARAERDERSMAGTVRHALREYLDRAPA
jgi:hypothetical protein